MSVAAIVFSPEEAISIMPHRWEESPHLCDSPILSLLISQRVNGWEEVVWIGLTGIVERQESNTAFVGGAPTSLDVALHL